MKLYSATYACPHCGQPHLVAGGGPGLVIEHGPDHAATAAELWSKGDSERLTISPGYHV